jgi:hypothetical protein
MFIKAHGDVSAHSRQEICPEGSGRAIEHPLQTLAAHEQSSGGLGKLYGERTVFVAKFVPQARIAYRIKHYLSPQSEGGVGGLSRCGGGIRTKGLRVEVDALEDDERDE